MKKEIIEEGKTRYYSEETDWNTPDGTVIAVWDGCDVKEDEYLDFVNFVKEEAAAEVEPVGSFKSEDDSSMFVFLVKTNVAHFSMWRFKVPGMRWWYDVFWSENGGRDVSDLEITPIIKKLGLTINGVTVNE